MACSNREASFFARYVFASSSICIPLSIYLIGSVCVVNLSVCFIGDVFFRFLLVYGVSSVFVLLIDWRKVKAFFGLVGTEAAISSSDWVSGCGVTGLMRAISSVSMVCNSNRDSNRNFNRDSGRLYLIAVRRNNTRPTHAV